MIILLAYTEQKYNIYPTDIEIFYFLYKRSKL